MTLPPWGICMHDYHIKTVFIFGTFHLELGISHNLTEISFKTMIVDDAYLRSLLLIEFNLVNQIYRSIFRSNQHCDCNLQSGDGL